MLTHYGKKYDLNFHIDVFNNEIVGYDLGNYHHGNGVMNHLRSLEDFLRVKEKEAMVMIIRFYIAIKVEYIHQLSLRKHIKTFL
ncbi:MAG: hypothetical protein PHW22_01410 [Bacilli bacterium]|nr:hypothetical protein [Bacilli bacterium]